MYNENGHTYSFDREYARSIIEQIVKQENADSKRYADAYYHSQKRCTKGEIYHLIADYIPISQDAVKKWFQKTNATDPGDISIVRKLEQFFGEKYGKTVILLRLVTIQEENMISMNETEKDCARELYIMLLDTIDKTIPSFRDYVIGLGNFAPLDSMAKSRYDAIMAIKKTALDLPESLRTSAIALVNDAFGPESNMPDAFFSTEDYKAFVASDEYQSYVTENYPSGTSESDDQLNYCEAKREELFSRLDEIFSAYIRRT